MAKRPSLLLLAILSCASAFVAPAQHGTNCLSQPRSRGSLGGRTSINAIPPWGGGESIADAILSPAGGFPDIWLAARDNTPDAYVATGLFGIAASAIVVGAGYLVASVVLGDQGIGAFLSKEKRDNPFYKDAIDQLKPNAPEFMNKIPLPDLDFVEVYNQSPRMKRDKAGAGGAGASSMIEDDQDSNSVMATAESLRQRLLEAVQHEHFDAAAYLDDAGHDPYRVSLVRSRRSLRIPAEPA